MTDLDARDGIQGFDIITTTIHVHIKQPKKGTSIVCSAWKMEGFKNQMALHPEHSLVPNTRSSEKINNEDTGTALKP